MACSTNDQTYLVNSLVVHIWCGLWSLVLGRTHLVKSLFTPSKFPAARNFSPLCSSANHAQGLCLLRKPRGILKKPSEPLVIGRTHLVSLTSLTFSRSHVLTFSRGSAPPDFPQLHLPHPYIVPLTLRHDPPIISIQET